MFLKTKLLYHIQQYSLQTFFLLAMKLEEYCLKTPYNSSNQMKASSMTTRSISFLPLISQNYAYKHYVYLLQTQFPHL